MGYYITYHTKEFLLPREDYAAAYRAACDLNDRDDLKRGISFGGDLHPDKPRPAGMAYHPARHFSWMGNDYPSELTSITEILTMLGFEVTEADEGIIGLFYNNKQGQEELFLWAIAPFVKAGSVIEAQGEEDDDHYRYEFDGYAMKWRGSMKIVQWDLTPAAFEPRRYPFAGES